MVIVGLQHAATQPSVWIVHADNQDTSIELAARTFAYEMTCAEFIVQEITLDKLDSIPLYSDAIVLIGHGQVEGLEVSDTILRWALVKDVLEERRPRLIILLACNSPSEPKSGVFGFPGQIDAEAKALLATWKVLQTLAPSLQANILMATVWDPGSGLV